ncbi:MAG: HDOD domain-containing protein [Candidatus Zixiibacteriota bacterium]|nr:MAG: HDOD domain-containing protein [candidate division Zixibacteria bacterium]
MKQVPVLDQIQQDSNLLSLPQVLSEVLQEVGKEDFSADSLANIILKDPSLTSRVLRMSNSSFYQRFAEIKTVHQAVAVLGVTTVKCLALSTSVFHPERIAKESGINASEFFVYVLSVAAASKKIAQAAGYSSTEEAFIAGLLHDIGLLFFLHKYPNEYRQITSREAGCQSLPEAEKQVFGVDHSEVGFHMAEAWRLPEEIVRSIRDHHGDALSGNENVLTNIVRLAVALTKDRFSGYELDLEDRLNRVAVLSKALSLTKEQVDEISSSLLAETFDIAQYLGVDIGDIEEMLTIANQEIWKSYLIIENLFKERQELSQNLLREERAKGAVESKNIAMATLSHYINNAVMAIYGRSQILSMLLRKGETEKVIDQLDDSLRKIDNSVKKIVAVLEEMKEVSPVDQQRFDSVSKTMNIDDRIQKRLARISDDIKWDTDVETSSDSVSSS